MTAVRIWLTGCGILSVEERSKRVLTDNFFLNNLSKETEEDFFIF